MSLSTELAAIAATLELELPLLRQVLEPASWHGSSWPTEPANNVPFFRTDLGLWAYFDGVRWLSVTEYESPFLGALTQPIGASGVDVGYLPTSPSDKYASSVRVSYYVTSTNNGSNYWTVAVLNSVNAATLGSVSSSAAS